MPKESYSKIYHKGGKKSEMKKIACAEIKKCLPPVELKQAVSYPVTFTLDNTNGIFNPLVNAVVGADLQQGTAHNQRVGDCIWVKRVKMGWTSCILNGQTDSAYRVIVVYDHSPQGTALSIADLFYAEGAAAAGYTAGQDWNINQVGRGKRFQILADRKYSHHLPFTAASATLDCDNKYHEIILNFKGKGKKVQFYQNSALGGIAAIEVGSITGFIIQTSLPSGAGKVTGLVKTITYSDA